MTSTTKHMPPNGKVGVKSISSPVINFYNIYIVKFYDELCQKPLEDEKHSKYYTSTTVSF